MKSASELGLIFSILLIWGCARQSDKGLHIISQNSIVDSLDQKIQVWMDEYNIPCAGIGYIEEGVIEWTSVYGIQQEGVKATDSTLLSGEFDPNMSVTNSGRILRTIYFSH